MTHATPKRLGAPKAIAPKPALRRFHQASWDEPVIFELSSAGQRGVLPPEPEAAIVEAAGDVFDNVPASLKRKTAPALPEMSQLHVLRHYMRLSQENLGVDLNIDIGQGTCTMKYSPKVNDQLARSHKLTDLHPLQPVSTVQGILSDVQPRRNAQGNFGHGPRHASAWGWVGGDLCQRCDDPRLS